MRNEGKLRPCGCEIYEVCPTCDPKKHAEIVQRVGGVPTGFEQSHLAFTPPDDISVRLPGRVPEVTFDSGPVVDMLNRLDKHRTRQGPDMDALNEEVIGLRKREGDQPLPQQNDLPAIQDLVKQDVEERKAIGLKRYGTLLQPHNGRDMLLDAYQEALDLCIYLRGCLYERDNK